MKKFAFYLLTTCLLIAFQPFQLKAETIKAEPSSLAEPKPIESTEAKVLLLRLDKINEIDKTELNSTEKKELRKEVRSIKHELKELGGGVFLSAGALIIIVILLIVLL